MTTMPAFIEYCVDNMPTDLRESLPTDAEASPCLMRCGLCHDGPIVVVDGELYCGDDHTQLLHDAGVALDR